MVGCVAMDPEAACDRIAAGQHGVLSRQQALDGGLTGRAIDRRVASGRWRVALSGVYVPRPVPSSWHQQLMCAVLSGGPTALVSHRAAAALWRLGGFEEPWVEVSLTSGHRIPGVIVHRRRADDDAGPSRIAAVPVTGVTRTLLDAATVLPE